LGAAIEHYRNWVVVVLLGHRSSLGEVSTTCVTTAAIEEYRSFGLS